MGAGNPNWLRDMTDDELLIVVQELQERAEEFSADTRALINDELRRRRLPLVSYGRSKH